MQDNDVIDNEVVGLPAVRVIAASREPKRYDCQITVRNFIHEQEKDLYYRKALYTIVFLGSAYS